MEPSDVLAGVEPSRLERIAAAASRRALREVVVAECRPIYRPRVASTCGVYLVTGSGRQDGTGYVWEAVLKVLAPAAAAGDPHRPPYEAFLYDSGFLATLPGPLAAPRCYGVTPLPGGDVGLWLERITDAASTPWTLDRYRLVARHLGILGGAVAADGPAAPTWLPAMRLRPGAAAWDANVARLRQHEAHSRVRRAYPPDVRRRLVALWEGRDALLDALTAAPSIASHGDAQRNNLFVRVGPTGEPHTVAIDWANFRRAPAGTDAATLVHQDLVFLRTDVARADQLDRAVFGGYWEGLAAGGWRGDRNPVRAAYALQMALVYGLHDLRLGLDLALDEEGGVWDAQADRYAGGTLADVLDRRAAVARFLLDLADEARRLLGIGA